MNELILWSPGMSLEQVERQAIEAAFRHYRQVKTATAASLGISVRTLEAKIEKYALDDVTQKERDAAVRRDREDFLARQRGVHYKGITTEIPSPAATAPPPAAPPLSRSPPPPSAPSSRTLPPSAIANKKR